MAKSFRIERRYTADFFLSNGRDARTLPVAVKPWASHLEDRGDIYTGEDDLTERAIENRNHEFAEMQTAIDRQHGM